MDISMKELYLLAIQLGVCAFFCHFEVWVAIRAHNALHHKSVTISLPIWLIKVKPMTAELTYSYWRVIKITINTGRRVVSFAAAQAAVKQRYPLPTSKKHGTKL